MLVVMLALDSHFLTFVFPVFFYVSLTPPTCTEQLVQLLREEKAKNNQRAVLRRRKAKMRATMELKERT